MFEICSLLSNWTFEIVGFVGKNKGEAGEAIEKIVKKNPVSLNVGFSGFNVKKTKPDRTETSWFEPIPVQNFQFFKILFWLFF
jgi:hypothetical protein